MQIKLDELIRSTDKARERLIALEHCTDQEVRALKEEFCKRRLGSGPQGEDADR